MEIFCEVQRKYRARHTHVNTCTHTHSHWFDLLGVAVGATNVYSLKKN